MRFKILFPFISFLWIGCFQAPTKYKEVNFPISKENIKHSCSILENNFSEYSCKKYFQQTFEWTENQETIEMELNRDNLKLIYKTNLDENDILFERYQQLIEELGKP